MGLDVIHSKPRLEDVPCPRRPPVALLAWFGASLHGRDWLYILLSDHPMKRSSSNGTSMRLLAKHSSLRLAGSGAAEHPRTYVQREMQDCGADDRCVGSCSIPRLSDGFPAVKLSLSTKQ